MNPFYCYSLTLTVILLLYNLKWSDLYMNISPMLMLFFLFTIIFSFGLGFLFNIDKKFKITIEKTNNVINIKKITIFILLAYILEFIYMKAIPFVEIMIYKSNYNYASFTGIPTFHVFLITFNSFICVYVFDRYMREKNKIYLLYFIINIIPSVLIYNRGMTMMILISSAFVYINHNIKKILNVKILSIILISTLFGSYTFGIFGNVRSNRDYYIGTDYTNTGFIMNVGSATQEFRNSNIPKPFFWTYLYVTSPLANLQKTINEYENNVDYSLLNFINRSIVPDFLSKRIDSIYNLEYKPTKLIYKTLTVSTFYSNSFIELGYLGLVCMYAYLIILIIVYRVIIPRNSSFFITGMSIVSTITVMNFFENMITFSGLCLQLIYPVIFYIYEYRKIKMKGYIE